MREEKRAGKSGAGTTQRFCWVDGHEGVWRLVREDAPYAWVVQHDVARPGLWRVPRGRPDQQRYEEDEFGHKDTERPIVNYRLVPLAHITMNGYREV